jgi:hypothetical protein
VAVFLSRWNALEIFSGFGISGLGEFLSSLSNAALAMFAFAVVLVNFIFSHYFLQYVLAFAYILAAIPIWRGVGLKVVRGVIIAYILYIPILLVGGIAINAIIANADSILMHTNGVYLLAAFMSAVGGMFVISILIPVVVLIFAMCARAPKVMV